jgi:spore coat polysaccharide biosynthesis protein SpsF
VNIVAIVQARMSSTRLPAKILKKIKDKVILDYVIERLRFCENLNDIVIATTTSKKDDILQQYAASKGISCFRGSEEDVLSRYYYAAKKYGADKIVRVTSDCPLIDHKIVDAVIKTHIENKADYTANIIERTFPRGLDVEIFDFNVLEDAQKNAQEKYQREHVTPYILEHPEKFTLQNVEARGKLRRPEIRITLDTKEDFELIKSILLNFDNLNFTSEEIIDFLDKNPKLLEINRTIKQKEIKE